MENNNKTKQINTICWCCKRATGYCNWSSELKPVKGWKIIPTKRELYGGEVFKSCIVLECPLFERDGYANGLKRYKEGDVIDAVSGNP